MSRADRERSSEFSKKDAASRGSLARARGTARIALTGLVLAAFAVGCSTPLAAPPARPPIESYVVGAPDELFITILPEPLIERKARVRPDGKISVDLIGDVQAAGLTPEQIAAAIQEKMGRFKRDASVSVSVTSSPSQFVTIYGEVATPGTFALMNEMRISEAIGQVGGTRPFASLNKIRIIRTDGNRTELIPVRLKDIANGDQSTNVAIREGDLIVVPPTAFAKVGYAVNMLFFPFQPLISGATSVGAVAAGVQTLRPQGGNSQ